MKRMFLACLTFLVAGVLVAGCGESNEPPELTPEQEENIRKVQEYMKERAKE